MHKQQYITPKGVNLVFEKQLGKGTFGEANAVKNRHGELFCLKKIKVSTKNEAAMNDVMREVDVMKETCSHPNVITFNDSWFQENLLCILMEYCGNGSLDRIIERFVAKKKRFSENKIVHYMQELSGALRYCHDDLRIMHRDLKPANVFVDEIGTLKLGDFGLAKSLDRATDWCTTYCGSPLYMSPEQCAGGSYSFSTDVWALGCILFELMAMHSPWWDERLNRCFPLLAIIDAKPPYEKIPTTYSDRLVDLAKWMMHKDTKHRATSTQIYKHLEMRSPPLNNMVGPIDPAGHSPMASNSSIESVDVTGDTLKRQAQLLRDAQVFARAALRIQTSFRASAPRGKKPAPARPIPAPAPQKHLDKINMEDSAFIIQNAFRSSRTERPTLPRGRPSAAVTPRLHQLAMPRGRLHVRQQATPRHVPLPKRPTMRMQPMPMAPRPPMPMAPRPAWV